MHEPKNIEKLWTKLMLFIFSGPNRRRKNSRLPAQTFNKLEIEALAKLYLIINHFAASADAKTEHRNLFLRLAHPGGGII